MEWQLTRRRLLLAACSLPLPGKGSPAFAQAVPVDWATAPIGWPDRLPGDGFRIGHGFACENTWFAAGWWHTGEDWYASEGDTGGALVYAVAAGEVVYADFNYPGRVVLVQHAGDLYSMYGHLDPALQVAVGDTVAAGDQLGRVLVQADIRAAGQAPSHLHFELRTFLETDNVNGLTPQHGVNCGFQCPPGPGYWPTGAAEHPTALGWRNPTHERFARLANLPDLGAIPNSTPGLEPLYILATPDATAEPISTLLQPSPTAIPVAEIQAGNPAGYGTSADAYEAWLRIESGSGQEEWVRAMVPSETETGSDGRPSSLDAPWLVVPQSYGSISYRPGVGRSKPSGRQFHP